MLVMVNILYNVKNMRISLENVYKTYKKNGSNLNIINNFSYTFDSGKIYLLKGCSGSGKTTLLSIIGLLDEPTSGNIIYDDKIVSQYDENSKNEIRKNDIGFVYQESNLFDRLTVAENIEVAYMDSHIRDLSVEIKEILEKVNLVNRDNHYPYELSGGEKQRVSIARALLKKPKVLICDEPISNLDEDNAKKLIGFLCEIRDNMDCIIFVSCHTSHFDQCSDEILYM